MPAVISAPYAVRRQMADDGDRAGRTGRLVERPGMDGVERRTGGSHPRGAPRDSRPQTVPRPGPPAPPDPAAAGLRRGRGSPAPGKSLRAGRGRDQVRAGEDGLRWNSAVLGRRPRRLAAAVLLL